MSYLILSYLIASLDPFQVLMYNPAGIPFGLKGDPKDPLTELDLPLPSPDYEDQWDLKVALRVEMELLNEINALQERILQASMQVRLKYSNLNSKPFVYNATIPQYTPYQPVHTHKYTNSTCVRSGV